MKPEILLYLPNNQNNRSIQYKHCIKNTLCKIEKEKPIQESPKQKPEVASTLPEDV